MMTAKVLPAGPAEEGCAAPEGATAAVDMAVPQKNSIAVQGDANAEPAFTCVGANASDLKIGSNLHLYMAALVVKSKWHMRQCQLFHAGLHLHMPACASMCTSTDAKESADKTYWHV